MTTATKSKRLEALEIRLTPKEWAIRLADFIRSFPSQDSFYKSISKDSEKTSPVSRPYFALNDQAKEQHPGKQPEDQRSYIKLCRSLRAEYHALKTLILLVNDSVKTKGEVAGLKAALKLARLESIVLQDAFGRTASKAAEWIEEYKTADAAEEENRKGMLEELAAYSDVYYGEKWSDSMTLPGGIRVRFPSVIEDWIAAVAALAVDVYGQLFAVQIVQKEHFDGHPILYQDVEAGLAETIKTLEDGIETFNAYLKTRAELFKEEWAEDEAENDGVSTAIPGEREGRLAIDIDSIRASAKKYHAPQAATKWVKWAKDKAKIAMLDEHDEGAATAYAWNLAREEGSRVRP